jgi:hypothetical protein
MAGRIDRWLRGEPATERAVPPFGLPIPGREVGGGEFGRAGAPVGVGLRGTSDLGMAEVRRAVRVRLAGRHPAVDRRLSTARRNVSASACAETRSAG